MYICSVASLHSHFSKIYETTWPVYAKFYMETSWDGGEFAEFGHMTNIAFLRRNAQKSSVESGN